MTKTANLVAQRSVSTGTGDFTLISAVGYRLFSTAFPDSSALNPFYYFIRHRNLSEFEVGQGYLVGGKLVRAIIHESSNGGELVDFSAGPKDIVNDVPADIQEQLIDLLNGNVVPTKNPFMDGPYMVGYNRCAPYYKNPVISQPETIWKLSKINFYSPQYDTNHIRIHFEGFSVGGFPPIENINGYSIQKIENVWCSYDNGKTLFPFTFNGGSQRFELIPNTLGQWSDDLFLDRDVPAESKLSMFTLYQVAPGDFNVSGGYQIQVHNGERIWGGATKEEVLANLDFPDSDSDDRLYEDVINYGQNQPSYLAPDLIIYKGWDGRPVGFITADSIGESRQEFSKSADPRGNIGYVRRWFDMDGEFGRVPFYIIGMPGATTARELNADSSRRWEVVKQIIAFNNGELPFTTWINQLGTNDLGGTLASFVTNRIAFRNKVRAFFQGAGFFKYLPMIDLPFFGLLTSTNNFIDLENQSYSTSPAAPYNFPGGTRDQIRDYIMNGIFNGLNDGAIDNRKAWSDPADNTKFKTGYFTSAIVEQAGTDGVQAYNTLKFPADHPWSADDIIRTKTSQTYNIKSVNGPIVEFRDIRSAVIPAGSVFYPAASPDGLHPFAALCRIIAAQIPQSEKAKLGYRTPPFADLSEFSYLASRVGAYVRTALTALKG